MARPLLRAPAPSPPVPLDLVVQRPSKKGLWKTSAYYDVLTSAEMVQNHFHDKRRWIAELHEYISAALNVNFWRAGDGSTSFENMLKVSLGRQRDLHYARLGSSSASDAVPPYFCQPTQLRICELLRMTRQEVSLICTRCADLRTPANVVRGKRTGHFNPVGMIPLSRTGEA